MPKPRKHPRLDPDAFVRAAEKIDAQQNSWACNALWYATGHTSEEAVNASHWSLLRDAIPEVAFFTAMLKPPEPALIEGSRDAWYDTPVEGDESHGALDDQARIFGLLLCSILAKERFRP